jgi:UDP-N-acetyl-D-glucosamine dehydrogenase
MPEGDDLGLRDALIGRIADRTARVAVIGLGYVGLPLAVELGRAGFAVVGIDVSADKVACVARGESYIDDVDGDRLRELVDRGFLSATTEYAAIGGVDCISICVPTPLRKTREPDLSCVVGALEALVPHLRSGQLVVLESTTYPGTTDEIVVPTLARSGLVAGRDVFCAFSPERVDPANPVFHTVNTPKVIGGATPACTEVACAFYGAVLERVVPVSSAAAAEMVKLLENTYRAINIGLANEMALICNKLGLDVWEIIDAAATKPFGFEAFYPGPGLGGHCIPIDPLYLSWKLRSLRFNARFIELADEVNRAMPEHCVGRMTDLLNAQGKAVRGSRVLILGMAYKRDVSDTRESPALDVAAELLARGAEVRYADPHVPRCAVGETTLEAVPACADEVSGADLVAVLTDHTAFDVDMLVEHAAILFDARNLTRGSRAPNVERL